MRKDIQEGALEKDMPRIGYGRIWSVPRLDEWYATVRLFDVRLFVASGRYGSILGNRIAPRRFRCWVLKK